MSNTLYISICRCRSLDRPSEMTIPETAAAKRLRSVFLFVAGIDGEGRKIVSKPSRSTSDIDPRSKEEEEIQENGRKPISLTTKPSQNASSSTESSTISEWVISMNEKLDQVPQSVSYQNLPWLTHCIYKVPKNLKEIEPKSYLPHIVSIGPYHRGKRRLRDMERHKWRLLHHLLDRTEHQLEPYLIAMRDLEQRTRSCYSESTDEINSQDFVEMMVLDGCFLLELLRATVNGFISYGYSWSDPIFSSRGALPCIQRDMLMLENQLPLFVLARLFELTSENPEQIRPETGSSDVTRLALEFFKSVLPGGRNKDFSGDDDDDQGLHLLHVVRKSLLPPTNKNVFGCSKLEYTKKQPHLMIHCVTRLRETGVTFKKRKSDNFMDIRFENGVLKIPPLVIHDYTKSIFLNMMAFEQRYPHCSNHVSSYASFMDGLINCPKDVRHLRAKGIVNQGLGSEVDVARLFNMLCREIAFDMNDCYLVGVSSDVERYYEGKWHWWWATLRHEYFHNPWAILSILVALLLIGLTLVQTFYTVFPYYVSRN